MDFVFTARVWEWRGPAPYHFVGVPDELVADLRELAADVTYGWGMVPVEVTVGRTTVETSLWPREGGYAVPLKDRLRRAEQVELGDEIAVRLVVSTRGGRLVE